jgi:ABC-type antimicrobial peptide transport system permease subunit
MAYDVSLRTHEIGIRMALGAQQSSIFKMILAKGARLLAAGIVIGLLASFGLTRFIASQVPGFLRRREENAKNCKCAHRKLSH